MLLLFAFAFAFVFAFLVVIPSAASEPASSRFSFMLSQILCASANHALSVLANTFLGEADKEREKAGSSLRSE